ncbi:uncharacterized protein BDR25DRAFT_373331 [Lindgomyces ingoldianus]|uniref:Uncharacterized protein n=1 Tax=Lindgomyces ingoldianus TaxID=673940 RepID=A0ACB6QP47_9PLEO|nr:uncharacterized protein BDR25DRAFT_373331 [Lindgomyces ingoldianus]KAF2468645.1 hypothetical protein BDR25DRAFT_373331 [Lindgomyces ingoldianus]
MRAFLGILVGLASATLTTGLNIPRDDPNGTFPNPHQPHIISTCTSFYKVQTGDNCWALTVKFGNFTLDDFYFWNPDVPTPKMDCSNLLLNYYVCISNTTTPTCGGTPVATPALVQPGIYYCCTRKFYEVVEGDTCVAVEKKFDLSDNIFRRLNTGIDANCYNLMLGYNVCVGIS